MTALTAQPPVILSFLHHDPSGNTGIQADIECAASLGCHSASIITALFATDTADQADIYPVDPTLVIHQARAILEDMPVKAIKVGFAGSIENVEAIHSILRDYPNIPVVVAPLTQSVNSQLDHSNEVAAAVEELLLPHSLVTSLDYENACQIAQQADSVKARAREILDKGCEYLVLSGLPERDSHNQLYGPQGLIRNFSWKESHFFCDGCHATFTAALSCYIGHALTVEEAVEQGINFTRQAMSHARRLGMGRATPNRFFWADRNR